FKKSGKSFERANEVVGKFATHHTVRQVRFHEKVSREQQEKIIANICRTAHLHHLGSGFFEDEKIHNYNETLINLIKNNVMCMKNNYVAGWRSLPAPIQDYAMRELIKNFKKNPHQEDDKFEMVSICRNMMRYYFTIAYPEIRKVLPKPSSLSEEKEFASSCTKEKEKEKEKAPELAENLKLLKDIIDTSKSFFSFGREKKKPDEIRNAFQIKELPQEIQEPLLSLIQRKIQVTRKVKGREKKPFVGIDFKPFGSDLIYNCMLESFVIDQYKQYLAVGPLMEIQNSLFLSTDSEYLSARTYSHFGDIVISPSLLLNIFLESIEEEMSILEIGPARGIETFRMLSRGAKVTGVDLSAIDLEHLKMRTPLELQKNLRLINAKFPTELNLECENKFDMIYMSHVAHYLTGEEFRAGIEKIASLLNPHTGRFYFQTLTPYSRPYVWNMAKADIALKELEENKSETEKNEWPGFFDEEEKKSEHAKRPDAVTLNGKTMPDFGHPLHPFVLERELKRAGFHIHYIGYGSLNTTLSQRISPLSYEEQEMFVKNSIFPTSLENKKAIFEKISGLSPMHMPWINALIKDMHQYRSNFSWPMKPAYPLETMTSVFAIACYGGDDKLCSKD
ncbi:MAG TPA: class I SAM-dependent methyltransferase, partial [Alphaproteobacteria bacterium]|nr:class I SAM-dependent methyltransferase [Alphaproteobacteria bacterium]